MKKIIAAAAVAIVAGALYAKSSTPAGFTDDLEGAIKASKESGKTVLAVFSGSDWCYWCKVLEKDYLSKKEFVEEASKKFELVFIDSPRDKSVLSEKAKANNESLTKKYGIRGFPTLKYIDSNGVASDAPRAGKGVSPKAYAEKLVSDLVLAPEIAKHLAPFDAKFQNIMKEALKVLRKEGNFFTRETEAEQKKGFDAAIAATRTGIAAIKALVKEFEAAEVPASIAEKKADLLRTIKGNLAGMERYASVTFEKALEQYKQMESSMKDRPAKRKPAAKGAEKKAK